MDRQIQVLLLEDDASDAELVQRELRKAGFNFSAKWAQDKRGFLAALEGGAPDVVLADFSLPGFDGLAALALAQQRFPDVPGIIVSGAIGEEVAIEALKGGATDYVLKQRLGRLGPAVERAIQEVDQLAERKRAEQALRESETRFRLLVEAVKDYAIITLDSQGRVVTWNAGAQRLKGYAASEILGQHFSRFYTPEAIAEGKPARVLTLVAEEGSYAEEGWRVRRDGSQFWASVTLTAIHGEAGELLGFAKVTRDMTERKQVEEELRAANAGAEQAKATAEAANAAKDHFLSVLSHELRTPLTPVLMTASAWECDAEVPAWIREDMGVIRRSVELEVRLIDDLLDLNRIIRGKLSLRLDGLDAHMKIISAVELCRADAEVKSLALTTDLSATETHLNGDAGRLIQIVSNLLKNAIKFTPAGGRIDVRTSNPTEGQLRIEVTDTGIGIPPKTIPRLFNAFEQADQQVTRHFGGLGLGLSISKALVEMHGGTIRAHSEGPGRGATFTVDLPAVASARQQDRQSTTAKPPAIRRLRILLVEDHTTTAQIMRRMLAKAGHEVRTAGTVCDALQVAQGYTFDVLISDIGLPDGTGFDVIRDIRARNPQVKGIAVSGFGMEQDIERSKAAGFLEHITKPVEVRTLQAALARMAEQ